MLAVNGTVTSPNYPEHYLNNLNCVWTVTVPSGYVSVEFLNFELESHPNCSDYDFVEIRQVICQLLFMYSTLSCALLTLRFLHTKECVEDRGGLANWAIWVNAQKACCMIWIKC